MCRLLLSNNEISLRYENHSEEIFNSNKGSPQGDGISGIFFTLALERALRDLRSKVNTKRTSMEHSYSRQSSIPVEMIYADDTDFISEDKFIDQVINKEAKSILQQHQLKVNDDKTEHTRIKRGKSKEEESWRKVKKLGSLLGDREDMHRRKQLSYAAMNKLSVILKSQKVRIAKKIKAYKSIVKPVLCYNMST